MQRPAADSTAASTSTVQQGHSHSQEGGRAGTHCGLQDGEEAYHGLILFDASSQWLEEFEEFESAPFTSGAHFDRTPIMI